MNRDEMRNFSAVRKIFAELGVKCGMRIFIIFFSLVSLYVYFLSVSWAPAGIFAGVGKGSAKRSVGKGVWGSAGSSPSGVWGRAPAQLASGSGGALWALSVGFGAKPRPPEDLVHCRGLKIVFLVLFTTTSMHKLLDSSVAERPECQKQF